MLFAGSIEIYTHLGTPAYRRPLPSLYQYTLVTNSYHFVPELSSKCQSVDLSLPSEHVMSICLRVLLALYFKTSFIGRKWPPVPSDRHPHRFQCFHLPRTPPLPDLSMTILQQIASANAVNLWSPMPPLHHSSALWRTRTTIPQSAVPNLRRCPPYQSTIISIPTWPNKGRTRYQPTLLSRCHSRRSPPHKSYLLLKMGNAGKCGSARPGTSLLKIGGRDGERLVLGR